MDKYSLLILFITKYSRLLFKTYAVFTNCCVYSHNMFTS